LQLDLPGVVLLMGAIICYLLALQWGGVSKPWSDSDVVGTLVGFGVLSILFGINEWWSEDRAMMPGRLFNRSVVISCSFLIFFAGAFFGILYFIPLYFQSIDGVSAAESGIRTLPLVLASGIFSTISGVGLGAVGYPMPFMLFGGVLTTVGSGLLYTLDLHTGSSKWIGYQALAGIGIGTGIQVPMIANQASVEMADLSSISAITLFFQSIAGSFFVQAAQAAFGNKLVHRLHTTAPDVNPSLVVATGATDLSSVFSPEQLPGILVAYMAGLKDTFALAIAAAGMATVVCIFLGLKNIKQKPAPADDSN
jgi:MFS transporter, DHA2 family, glioxin efflux transporter